MLKSSESIGKLDRRITFIQRIVDVGDSNEEKIVGWEQIETDPTVWTRKKEKIGSEIPLSDQLTYVQESHFIIRSRTDLNVLMRCVFEGQVYEILSITEVDEGRKRFLNVASNLIQNEFFS